MSSKLREALEEAHTLLKEIHSAYSDSQGDISIYQLRKVIAVVEAALDEPLRNCDVGTAEEQDERFDKFCESHTNCAHCPLKGTQCSLVWSQMPYEEVAK